MPPARPPNLLRKERSLHLTKCARKTPKKRYPHFLPIQHRCCPTQGFLDSNTSTSLVSQEKSHCPTEGYFPQPSYADQSRRMIPLFRLTSSEGRRRAHHAAHTSLGHSNAWRLCANARSPTDPIWARHLPTVVCPTSLAPRLSSLGHRPSLEPTISSHNDSPNTSELRPMPP